MTLPEILALGLIQGITEFFPISSSTHLVMLQQIFGIHNPSPALYVFLHAGSLIAIVVYLWRDIISLFTERLPMLALLVVASISTAVVWHYFPSRLADFFGRYRVMGVVMAASGAGLIAASYVNRDADRCDGRQEPGVGSAVSVGIAQGLGVIPGISRSAMTIMGSIFAGFDRESVFRFSFLLAVPVLAAEIALRAVRIGSLLWQGDIIGYLLGAAVAMAISYASLAIMRRVLCSNKLYPFGIYCLVIGIAMAVFQFKLR